MLDFNIDEKVIITDYVDDEKVYTIDVVRQIVISKDDEEYIFDRISRPVHLSSNRLFKYTIDNELKLMKDGYGYVHNLI